MLRFDPNHSDQIFVGSKFMAPDFCASFWLHHRSISTIDWIFQRMIFLKFIFYKNNAINPLIFQLNVYFTLSHSGLVLSNWLVTAKKMFFQKFIEQNADYTSISRDFFERPYTACFALKARPLVEISQSAKGFSPGLVGRPK